MANKKNCRTNEPSRTAATSGLLTLAIAFASGLIAQPATAQTARPTVEEGREPGWRIEPAITAMTVYTDNLLQDVDGQEVDDVIWQLVPRITLDYTGPRLTGTLDYQAQGVYFTDNTDFNEVYHQALSSLSSELVSDHLFLDASANYFQQVVDPLEQPRFSSVVPTGNFTNSLVAYVSPRWEQRLGSIAEATVTLLYGEVNYYDTEPAAQQDEGTYSGGRFVVQSPEDAGRFSWRLFYSRQEADYEVVSDVRFDEALAQVGVALTPSLRFLVAGGYDSDVEESLDDGGLDESRWEAGFRWQKGPRHRLEVLVGERFFGDTYSVDWSYSGRVLELGLTYDEQPTTLGQEELDRPDSFLAGSASFDALPLGVETEPYVLKAGGLTIGLEGSRNSFDISYYSEERHFIETQETTSGDRAEANWELRLGARTTLLAQVDWQEIEIREDQGTQEVLEYLAGVQRRVTSTMTATFRLQRFERSGDTAADESTENVASLEFVKRFGDARPDQPRATSRDTTQR